MANKLADVLYRKVFSAEGILMLALLLAALGLFGLSRTAQAGQPQYNAGIAFTSDGTATSPPFRPRSAHVKVAVYVKATRAGTFKVQRQDGGGSWNDIIAPGASTADNALTANTESLAIIDFPTSVLRVSYTNTDHNAGSYRVEFIDGGEK